MQAPANRFIRVGKPFSGLVARTELILRRDAIAGPQRHRQPNLPATYVN